MHLISSNDLSKEQINKIFKTADAIKEGSEELSVKEGSVLALLFEKSSTRTRLAFEVAMAQLGGRAVYIDAQTTQLKRGESMADTARMMSSYCNFVAARLYDHNNIIEMATNSKIPVINALTDLEHPTQALTDMYTVREHKKNLKNIRIAFVGDIAANTANSLMITATKLGSEVVLVGPKDCLPNPIYFNKAREYGSISATSSIADGIDGVDIIYTDTFVSMGQEANAEARKKLFESYIVDKKMLSYASKDVLVMHCLPAHRGEEIAADVIDGPKSIVWEQAKNKLLIAKAVLLFLSKASD